MEYIDTYLVPFVGTYVFPPLSSLLSPLLSLEDLFCPQTLTYFILGILLGTAILVAALNFAAPANKRGYGSGENNRWNRLIRTERPMFNSKHHKLEHTWAYAGSGAVADMDVARKGQELAVTAKDAFTGGPLSGHLIGRQTWKPVKNSNLKGIQDSLTFDPSVNVNSGDKLLRAQMLLANGGDPADANPKPPRGSPSVSSQEALQLGWEFYEKLLTDDGHYAGDYGGPLFLMPGFIIACHIGGVDLKERKSAMVTYLKNHQQADGGWGLHIEGPSTVFGTVMNYVSLRLLGLPATDEFCVAARKFIHAHGGATMAPHWGKFWLATLGVYDWDGVNPIPPELWLLPRWFPYHPGKMWCHCRMVYLPMSYVYGGRFTAPIGSIQEELRKELYLQAYSSINWDGCRNTCATIDLYAPHTTIMEVLLWGLSRYEKYAPSFILKPLLKAGLDFALNYLEAEDLQTNYVDIGPVNKAVNMLATFFAHGSASEQFKRHASRIDDYLWIAEDGMKMQGYNGSQSWDTSFALQALVAAGPEFASKFSSLVRRMYCYLDATQIKNNVPKREEFFRTISKGGWPFSTNDHGWPIADCTAEGMKATLAVRSLALQHIIDLGQGFADGFGTVGTGLIAPQRYFDAIEVLKAFHNPDGGWATYEEMRGGPWYEYLNPAEVFGDIMIDYTYTELTSAVVTGLVAFQRHFPDHRPADVGYMISRGTQYVREQQREDGSWYGSWAVCFTYGCWFGVETLVAAGDPAGRDRRALEKCCAFLLSKQRSDGGWGESYLSCLTKQYSQGESTVVNTAWALLSLIHAQCGDAFAVRRGIDFLISKQSPAGDWAQETVSGIFNRTCSITYTAYRNLFPLWALAAYSNSYRHCMDRPLMGLSAADLRAMTENQSKEREEDDKKSAEAPTSRKRRERSVSQRRRQ